MTFSLTSTARGAVAAALLLLLTPLASAQPLRIESGWVSALPPAQRMTAAYMTLHNSGDAVLQLLSVSSESADHASIHATQRDGDRVRMEAAGAITLQPGERVGLEPGGLHIMLMGLARMPAAGETFPLCLQTSAGELCEALPVLREAPSAAPTGGEQ